MKVNSCLAQGLDMRMEITHWWSSFSSDDPGSDPSSFLSLACCGVSLSPRCVVVGGGEFNWGTTESSRGHISCETQRERVSVPCEVDRKRSGFDEAAFPFWVTCFEMSIKDDMNLSSASTSPSCPPRVPLSSWVADSLVVPCVHPCFKRDERRQLQNLNVQGGVTLLLTFRSAVVSLRLNSSLRDLSRQILVSQSSRASWGGGTFTTESTRRETHSNEVWFVCIEQNRIENNSNTAVDYLFK